jgi:hypothetical protein
MKKPNLDRLFSLLVALLFSATVSVNAAEMSAGSDSSLGTDAHSIWEAGIGEGFRVGTYTLGFSAGASAGVAVFGGKLDHDLALMSLNYGRVISEVKGIGHWYRGNWELRGELFGGSQFSPNAGEWVVGLAPHLRYNFASGSHWVPFLDGGAGVSATSINRPDLSNTFEFNLQACVGVQWFLRDQCAITLEARWLHLSCAGISTPNQGVNTIVGMIGVSWFF